MHHKARDSSSATSCSISGLAHTIFTATVSELRLSGGLVAITNT